MRVLINGYCGHMGREVAKLCREGYRGASAVMGIDPHADGSESIPVYASVTEVPTYEGVECIVDFSHHSCVRELLDYAVEYGIPTVVATTGHTEDELEAIRLASESIPVFYSANMSLGVALLVELATTAAAAMPEAEIEIIEKHHKHKKDSPSGTAKLIADNITNQIKSIFWWFFN